MDGPYATPRLVTDPADCYFYHTIDLPGLGRQDGEWDLRFGIDDYLGRVELMGRRVLEVGTASGFVCFHMESRAAEVVALDLSPEHTPDVVPYARGDPAKTVQELRAHIARINRSFWLGHRLFQSRARVVYGSAYAIPDSIGPVDISVLGCVLLHLRDPFLALAQAARLTRQQVVIVEPVVYRSRWRRWLQGPSLRFFPQAATGEPKETWWVLGPEVLRSFLAVLGFEDVEVHYHRQLFRGQPVPMFTVVGRRTHGGPRQ